LHDARHTHASIMLKQGIHPKIVQERLGHANIAITLDTYSHVSPRLQDSLQAKYILADRTPMYRRGCRPQRPGALTRRWAKPIINNLKRWKSLV